MSTTSLRQAAAAGVDVCGAGRVNLPSLCLVWVLWLWSSCFFAQLPFGSWLWLDAVCAVAWAAAWLRRPDDQKAFAGSALAFFTICRLPCVVLACTILGGYRRRYVGLAATERLAAFLLPCAMSLSLLQLLLLFVPLGLIARIPLRWSGGGVDASAATLLSHDRRSEHCRRASRAKLLELVLRWVIIAGCIA